ncbi:MAG: Crp/Fnr family transcriptional regulator [Halomonas sp.]|nr:Crp/Fnr family transcriptional regulator [Halomonas sp.]TVP51083.1 MAG: Crp/Fnr family transcriptional regulator [Halomonas sp.]
MTSDVTEIHSKTVGGGRKHAQMPSHTVTSIMMTIGDILSRYGSLSAEAFDRLSNMNVSNLELKKNQKLYSSSRGKSEIFLVKKGWISLCHVAKHRGHDICNVYMPGDIVGVRESFFDNHNIALLALQNCQLDKIYVDELHAVFKDYDDIKRAVVSYIMVNDNVALERLRSCTHLKAEERVAHFLLEIYARYNYKEMVDSSLFYFPITQDVVGELLGITSVHVSRCLTALEQKKLIRKSRSTIRLLEPQRLAELTGFDEDMIYSHVRFV